VGECQVVTAARDTGCAEVLLTPTAVLKWSLAIISAHLSPICDLHPLASILTGGSGAASSGSITPGALIPQLRALARDKKVAAVVLRVDSPGGDALASDLMWREIRQLGEGTGRGLIGARGVSPAC
jgi:hypothetical protein